MFIEYIDRKTKTLCREKVYGSFFLSLLYSGKIFPGFVCKFFRLIFAKNPFFSYIYGKIQSSKISRYKIAPFVKNFSVDLSEFEIKKYESFNDFFIRKLKKDARKLTKDPLVAIAPCDGRYLVYQHVDALQTFLIKGRQFHIKDLISDSLLYEKFKDGSLLIARLCPSDYHRFHFIDNGVCGDCRNIDGYLQSVNPIAWKKNIEIFWTNKRVLQEFFSENFGHILYLEIGATCVGSIHQTSFPGQIVKKGDELGYFSFGGSCVILLFEKGKIQFDSDLIQNSINAIETKVNFGDSLGNVISPC